MEPMLRFSYSGKIFLSLPNIKGGRPMHIATLVGRTLMVRKKLSHRYWMTDGYAFCYEMILRADFDILEVYLGDGTKLVTTKQFLLEKGVVGQEKGYEEQIFLTVKHFDLEQARIYENQLREEEKKEKMNSVLWDFVGVKRPKWGKK